MGWAKSGTGVEFSEMVKQLRDSVFLVHTAALGGGCVEGFVEFCGAGGEELQKTRQHVRAFIEALLKALLMALPQASLVAFP